jgi:UDP-3-O-[3-hydroxymyristoyl] glucosamine N-acyltransferase
MTSPVTTNKTTYTLGRIAELVEGEVDGDSSIPISGVSGIKEAGAGDITFLDNPRYRSFLDSTKASAVIVRPGGSCPKPSIRIEKPYEAFLKTLHLFRRRTEERYERGVHPTAVVHPSARLGRDVAVCAHVVIEENVTVGDGTTLLPGCCFMAGAEIGRGCLVYPNVTVREECRIGDRVILHAGAVVGSDGFGFLRRGGRPIKVPHIGIVVIEDDVEVGANVTIDRATAGVTRIAAGAKLDNLVHVAHNAMVGENTLIAAQVGISGSTEVGREVVLAGQAGLVGHILIGDGATVGAQAGVTKSVAPGSVVSGYPARPHGIARKIHGFTQRLPHLFRRMQSLEERIEGLEKEARESDEDA